MSVPMVSTVPPAAGAERDADLLSALRRGDETAFETLVRSHHTSMTRLAGTFVTSSAEAEEVVQETWMAVIQGLGSFEERSSLKTWIFGILVNKARSRAVRERRSVPFSSLSEDADEFGATVDPSRFRGPDDPFAGYWTTVPYAWWSHPEQRAGDAETRTVIEQALVTLPERQRQVVVLHDVEGWSVAEVCRTLGLTEGNQRVLLHRGRGRLRAALEDHFAGMAAS